MAEKIKRTAIAEFYLTNEEDGTRELIPVGREVELTPRQLAHYVTAAVVFGDEARDAEARAGADAKAKAEKDARVRAEQQRKAAAAVEQKTAGAQPSASLNAPSGDAEREARDRASAEARKEEAEVEHSTRKTTKR